MKYHYYCVVNKDNIPQGLDEPSGGTPYSCGDWIGTQLWGDDESAEKYCRIINYGDKGYSVKDVVIEIQDET
jgi:hypothetical protein